MPPLTGCQEEFAAYEEAASEYREAEEYVGEAVEQRHEAEVTAAEVGAEWAAACGLAIATDGEFAPECAKLAIEFYEAIEALREASTEVESAIAAFEYALEAVLQAEAELNHCMDSPLFKPP